MITLTVAGKFFHARRAKRGGFFVSCFLAANMTDVGSESCNKGL